MERITSKLTRVLVITLFTAATLATVGSLSLKASGVMPQGATPIPPMPSCDKFFAASEQKSPYASFFLSGCAEEMRARGAAIQNRYPWAAQVRNQQQSIQAQRGFDIGMAAAEGHTQDGPRKKTLRDALNNEERSGYIAAVSRSLEWNLDGPRRLAELEARGAVLTSQDQEASVMLNQEPNASARRGFLIGMAAAEGNTQRGPLKDGIGASLKPEEQGGFDDAISYSLTHNKILASKVSTAATSGANLPSGDPSTASGSDMPSDPSAGDPFAREPLNRRPARPIRRGSDRRNLRATLEHLRQGREYLEDADSDPDGHREKAIDYTNKAIEELKKALAATE